VLAEQLDQNEPHVNRLVTAYQTVRNLLAPDRELAEELDAIEAAGLAAAVAGDTGEARRHLYRAITTLVGRPWTPREEYAHSLVLRSDMVVTDPARPMIVRLGQLYPAGWQYSTPPEVVVELAEVRRGFRDAISPGATVRELGRFAGLPPDLRESPFAVAVDLAGIPDGSYLVTASVLDGETSLRRLALPVQLVAGIDSRRVDIERRLAALSGVDRAAPSVRYPFDLALQINLGRQSAVQRDVAAELARSIDLLAALERGEDPLSVVGRPVVRHYLFEAAGEIMPFGLYVPSSWSAGRAMPLVVVLHGQGGNEVNFLERQDRLLPRLAEQHGYIVVTPLGYRSDGGYGGAPTAAADFERRRVTELSEQDVIDVLALVRREYLIDADRIYLMGHSMGGNGTWHLGSKYADVWAALAPIAGGSARPGRLDIDRLSRIPILCCHGDADATASVEASRRMTAAVRAAGGDCTLLEVPGATHRSIVPAVLSKIFEFFDGHSKAR
jgi:poly(3-hydroxybutyrate) depolymerase